MREGFLCAADFNKDVQTSLVETLKAKQRMKGEKDNERTQHKDSNREMLARLPGNPEIHETSGVGCPPLTNLGRHRHRCVGSHTSAFPDCVSELHSSLFTTCASSFLVLSLFLHTHSDFPLTFLFLQRARPLSSGWLLTFSVLSPGSFKELRRWRRGRSVSHW